MSSSVWTITNNDDLDEWTDNLETSIVQILLAQMKRSTKFGGVSMEFIKEMSKDYANVIEKYQGIDVESNVIMAERNQRIVKNGP